MQVTILKQGPGWLALDKPAGLSVHNDPEGKADALSLVAKALAENAELAKACRHERGFQPAPAHRLDRETSGVLILATRKEAASRLGLAFQERRAEKIYRAIVRGELNDRGIWNSALTDRAEGRRNPQGPAAERKTCETRYKVLRTNKHLSELEIALGTGRQHQIRRHAALDRHEVLGDRRYGDPKFNARIETLFGVTRLLLHARLLALDLEGERIEVEAPLPPEFNVVFEAPPKCSPT